MAKREIAAPELDDVSGLLRRGGYLKAYDALVRQAEREAVKTPKTTVAQRKEILREAIETFDVAKLADLQAKASALIDIITSNEIDPTGGILSKEDAHDYMAELLGEADVVELLAVRREMMKHRVFRAMTEELGIKGVEDPENHNHSIPVPTLGKRFVREACGPKEAELSEEKLQKLLQERLGDEAWESVCEVELIPEQYIPEHIEYTLSIESLMRLARTDPRVLEIVRESLEVGGWKSPRFAIKDL